MYTTIGWACIDTPLAWSSPESHPVYYQGCAGIYALCLMHRAVLGWLACYGLSHNDGGLNQGHPRGRSTQYRWASANAPIPWRCCWFRGLREQPSPRHSAARHHQNNNNMKKNFRRSPYQKNSCRARANQHPIHPPVDYATKSHQWLRQSAFWQVAQRRYLPQAHGIAAESVRQKVKIK